ncbi:MAG: FG-GAP-like repeat-containing protein [Pirellulaceae bacterium]
MKRHETYKLVAERLEDRRVLAVVSFAANAVGDSAAQASSVFAADIDNDGDLDIVTASDNDNSIAWYPNQDGLGSFGSRNVISTEVLGSYSVTAADIDGDGDVDVISASLMDDKIAWYENLDGAGTFGTQNVVTDTADGAESVRAADLDGDGDLDLLVASEIDSLVSWYENLDGRGEFGPQHIISDQASDVEKAVAADLDGDGDLDVLSASFADNKIAWYENVDGSGTFGSPNIISAATNGATVVIAADLDGDQDLDIVTGSYTDGTIEWYSNDGQGGFAAPQSIGTNAIGVYSLDVADMDQDGDLDVISAAMNTNTITWYENGGTSDRFVLQYTVSSLLHRPMTVISADLDNDGDMDIVSASSRNGQVTWFENRVVGDANDDGRFDSSDLILVFQAGEYEDDTTGNSTYADGDWNGDREFDSGDLVLAFQAGTYAEAARTATVDQLFALTGDIAANVPSKLTKRTDNRWMKLC